MKGNEFHLFGVHRDRLAKMFFIGLVIVLYTMFSLVVGTPSRKATGHHTQVVAARTCATA